MEVQVAGRVMADMFDDGSLFLASFGLLNMTATDKTLDLEGKEHLEWHGCDLSVVQVFSQELRELYALNLLPTNDQDP